MSFTLKDQVERPDVYSGAIPCDSTLPLSIVNVKGQLTLRVRAGAGSEPIFGSGAIVSNMRNGYNDTSIFVKSSATPTGVISTAWGSGFRLTARDPYISHMRMPLSPALEDSSSVGVLAAARVSWKSNTLGTTSASLGGEVAAAAIADFRDLDKWSQNELCSLAVSSASAFMGKSITDESYMWLGPDVMGEPMPINSDLVRATGSDVFTRDILTVSAQQQVIEFFATSSTDPARNILRAPKIPLTAKLRVRVRFVNALGGDSAVHFKKVWVRGDPDPALPLQYVAEDEYYGGVSPASYTSWTHWFEFERPDLRAQGYVPGALAISCNASHVQIQETNIWILDMYGKQHFGGWRIGLWEDAAVGMNLSVAFQGAALATLVGDVAEYKKASIQSYVSDSEWNNFKKLFMTNALTRVSNGPATMDVSRTLTAGVMAEQGIQMGMFSDLLSHGAKALGGIVENALPIQMAGMHQSKSLRMAGMVPPNARR